MYISKYEHCQFLIRIRSYLLHENSIEHFLFCSECSKSLGITRFLFSDKKQLYVMKECVATFIADYAAGIFLTASALLFHLNLTIVPQMNDRHYSSSPLLYITEQFQRACHFPKFTYRLKSKVWVLYSDLILRIIFLASQSFI